jgi:hypothetical protein
VPDEAKTTLLHLEVLTLLNLGPDLSGSYVCEVVFLTGRHSARYGHRGIINRLGTPAANRPVTLAAIPRYTGGSSIG